jgi:hypothetical protein
VNAAIAHGENPADKKRAARKEMTFGALFAEYLERHARHNKRTWSDDEEVFRRHLRSLAMLKLSSIKRSDVGKIHSQDPRSLFGSPRPSAYLHRLSFAGRLWHG